MLDSIYHMILKSLGKLNFLTVLAACYEWQTNITKQFLWSNKNQMPGINFGSIPFQTLTGRIIYTKQFYLNWSYLPISHCIQFDSKGYEKPNNNMYLLYIL